MLALVMASLKRKREKDLDGLNRGEFDSLEVAGDGLIRGNLTVQGTINGGGGGGGGTTEAFFSATDTSNQFRAAGSTFDLKSSGATPTFRLLNSSNATSSSTLQTGSISSGAISSTGVISTTNNTQSTSPSTGSITTAGGIGAQGNIHSGQQIHAQGTAGSTSTTTGALLSNGGLGVAQNGTFGGSVTSTGNYVFTSSGLIRTSTTDGADNQSIVVTGGGANTAGTRGAKVELYGNEGSLPGELSLVSGDSGTIKFYTGAQVERGSISNTGVVRFLNTTDSTSSTTGGLVVSGGVGITDTAEASSSTNGGALTVGGGIAVAGRAYIGSRIYVGGSPNAGSDGSFRLIRLTPFTGSATQITFDRSTATGTNQNYIYSDNTNMEFLAPAYLFNPTGVVTIANASNATSPTTGALRVTGGVGISGTLNVSPVGGIVVGAGSWTTNTNDIFLSANASTIYLRPTTASGNGEMANGTTSMTIRDTSANVIWTLDKSALLLTQTTPLFVNNSTQATSTTTGAIRTAGGISCQGNLHVGGTITGGSVSYGTTTSGTFTVTNGTGQTFVVDSTQASTSPTTGGARFKGGVGIEGDLNVGGTITGGAISYGSTSTGTLAVTNGTGNTLNVSSTTNSTSTTTGSITTAGGIGIAQDIRMNGFLYLKNIVLACGTNDAFLSANNDIIYLRPTVGSANASLEHGPTNSVFRSTSGTSIWTLNKSTNVLTTTSQHLLNSSVASTTTTTGALVVVGGVGIQGALNVGGNTNLGTVATGAVTSSTISASSINATGNIASTNTSTGSIVVVGGVGVSGAVNAATVSATGTLSGSTQALTGNVASTSTTTGTLVITGGLGVSGTINSGAVGTGTVTTGALTVSNPSGQTVVVSSTQDSSSPTTGAARVVGGLGVGGNVWTGGVVRSETEVAVERSGAAEVRVYNQGGVAEWLAGQRSVSDHNYKISTKVGPTVTTRAEINTLGQLKIGAGSFFGYFEGSWTPEVRAIDSGGGGTVYSPFGLSYTTQTGFYTVVGKTVTLTYQLDFNYSGVIGPSSQYCLIRGIPAGLEVTTQTEVTQSCFRGTFAGITNPFYSTIWKSGYTIPGVHTFDGRSFTIGVYNSGNYLTGAFQLLGAGNQQMWGTFTYTLP